MAVELTQWSWPEAIRDERELALFLAVLLEEQEDEGPTVFAASVDVAAKVRGGLPSLAHESGIPLQELEAAMQGTEEQAMPVVQRLAAAYSRFLSDQRVA